MRVLLDDSSRHRHGIQRRPRSEPTGIIVAASQIVRDTPQPKTVPKSRLRDAPRTRKMYSANKSNQQICSADEFF